MGNQGFVEPIHLLLNCMLRCITVIIYSSRSILYIIISSKNRRYMISDHLSSGLCSGCMMESAILLVISFPVEKFMHERKVVNYVLCAMKEVTLFSDDAKSKESAKQLMQLN
ncbi:hypothetical protein VNO77_33615 [Canavalia gladiata]|uniref:Uncharacterized protein n=1 Tax=Canavalia gladiata TaxID=3824 RepID=A0AAN9KE88_CANGL